MLIQALQSVQLVTLGAPPVVVLPDRNANLASLENTDQDLPATLVTELARLVLVEVHPLVPYVTHRTSKT
jgi:hypothetical protein